MILLLHQIIEHLFIDCIESIVTLQERLMHNVQNQVTGCYLSMSLLFLFSESLS